MLSYPEWLRPRNKTKTEIEKELKKRSMRASFKTKAETQDFLHRLGWAWRLPWRDEQKKVLRLFFSETPTDEIIIQAIFGGGKTTMMLAIIFILCLYDHEKIPKIFVCAFNIGIRNELRKKTRPLGKFKVSTYDSLIYHCCALLGYTDLKLLNFDAKRRFVRENMDRLPQDTSIEYVFVDETQDLEKNCYGFLKHYFPRARFMFVGDVFQSIQKEPRESLLWFLLNRKSTPSTRVFRMLDTPRVPSTILDEMKVALAQYYPEFSTTIQKWESSSTLQKNPVIHWVQFQSYHGVYQKILEALQELPHKDTMLLTFSSAVTVRGSLGDIARFRKFLETHGVQVNPNHKRMLDDRLFLSTANSSKGLERKHVICVLTFPLELAFANFSNDLVMNLLTVALSRCKEDVTFYVPNYTDRFSKVLQCFSRCPLPCENPKPKKKTVEGNKECQTFDYDPSDKIDMLQKEHSVTEILKQSILSFETRQLLLRYSRNESNYELAANKVGCVRTEEECALTGLLFECLILSLWSHKFPSAGFGEIQHHGVFAEHVARIRKCSKMYNGFIKKYSKIPNESIRFTGSFLYAQLHLFAHQKIWIAANKEKNKILYQQWISLLPYIKKIPVPPGNLKTQVNIKMPLLSGIMDAARIPGKGVQGDTMDIYEIKASRSGDWKTNALLQATLYGILSVKAFFNIYLVNVFSRQAKLYKVYLKKDLGFLRNRILQDILNWNTNCFLAKNLRHKRLLGAKILDTTKTIFVDGRWDSLHQKWIECSICEFVSPTRVRFTILDEQAPPPPTSTVEQSQDSQGPPEPPPTVYQQLLELLEKYQKIYGIDTIYALPDFYKHFKESRFPVETYMDTEKFTNWEEYVEGISTSKKPEEIKLDWSRSYNTLALVVCGLTDSEKYTLDG